NQPGTGGLDPEIRIRSARSAASQSMKRAFLFLSMHYPSPGLRPPSPAGRGAGGEGSFPLEVHGPSAPAQENLLLPLSQTLSIPFVDWRALSTGSGQSSARQSFRRSF